MTAAPSAVEAPLTSRTLPLLRFTSTYQALVSTVAADAVFVTTVSSPPTNTTANTAANPDRHRRRHLAVRANLTDIASFLSSLGLVTWGIADLRRAASARTPTTLGHGQLSEKRSVSGNIFSEEGGEPPDP